MWRTFAGLAVLCGAGLVVGSAASLPMAGRTLGTAAIGTPRCTAAELGVIQNLSAGTVISVTVSGLPASCGGATLEATVHNGLTSAGGVAAIPAGGGSVTVTLATAIAVTAVEQTDLVVLGP